MYSSNSIYLKKQTGSGISDIIYAGIMKKMGADTSGVYPGEKHAPLMVNGRLKAGNYIGPGTRAGPRIMMKQKGITAVDEVARRHDALYSLAETKDHIRAADKEMVTLMKSGKVKDNEFNLQIANLMAIKYYTELKTGVKFPSQKDLDGNKKRNASNAALKKALEDAVAETGKMFDLPQSQSGSGIGEWLTSFINWLFGNSKKQPKGDPPPEEKPNPPPRREEKLKKDCREILAEHGITDKRSWRRFALKNHPDKGGDTELFQIVSDCVDKSGVKEGNGLLQAGDGVWDMVKGILKDPSGALVAIFDTFGDSKTWKVMEDWIRTDSFSQEVISKMDDAMDVITSVVKDIPVVNEIAELPFAGWEAYSKEFKQTDKTKIKPKTLDFLKGLGQWKIYQKLHPDIGDDWMETITKEIGRLGFTQYKKQIPRITADMLRRTALYLKYLTEDIKKRLNKLNAESIRIVKDVGGSRGQAIVDAVKSNPRGVSQEFRILLGKEWSTYKQNPLLKELYETVFPNTAYLREH